MAAYFFQKWTINGVDDAGMPATITVQTANIDLIANYAPGYRLVVDSSAPVNLNPVGFNDGTSTFTTRYDDNVEGGLYTLTAITTSKGVGGKTYNFVYWQDLLVAQPRGQLYYSFTLSGDKTLYMVYEEVVSPTFDFSINATPSSSPTIAPGGSTSFTVTATLVSGTAASVSLNVVSGLPAYATAQFVPSSVTPTASSTLTVITTVNTPTGSPQLTIRGTSGTLTHDAYVTLNVGGGGATGTITVRGYSGTMEVPVTGNIKETDTGTVVVSSFSTAPPNAYSWDQAVANRRYTVAAYYNGIPREEIVTVAAGAIRNVNPQFLQVVTGEFPLWAVAVVGGGVLAVGVYALATRKPSRKR